MTKIHNPTGDDMLLLRSTDGQDPADHSPRSTPINVAIFFDGTGNNLNSTTNVGRLHQLVVNQDRTDNAVFYTSGVGADRTGAIGLGTGLGFRNDVEEAYGFLSDSYERPEDVIHLYGYSRGAFAARALAGLVHTVGLVDLSVLKTQKEREQFLSDLFTAYKFPARGLTARDCTAGVDRLQESIALRRCATKAVRKAYGVNVKPSGAHQDVRFSIVGLWDTVETLGLPNGTQDPDEYNHRYSDQICNMDRVLHAVSLHDNRATTYTPILMTRNRLVRDCEGARDPGVREALFDRVEEVWFAGDHGQIGGTEDLGYLSGVSLNWMLSKAADVGVNNQPLFPKHARVYEQPLDFVKDAERQDLFFQTVFKRQLRTVSLFVQPAERPVTAPLDNAEMLSTGSGRPCEVKIHTSVEHWLKARKTITSRDRQPIAKKALPMLSRKVVEKQISDLEDAKSDGCPLINIEYVD
ncbi:DUF2235 domain-containing protein [Sulfitobacter sp. HNIBRBA3233]|uniref:DUF2235 domain-containing protein n=1 Tax=Sulfitobacter marinivivus TaxID=3158558 RepID=UPI0032E0137A